MKVVLGVFALLVLLASRRARSTLGMVLGVEDFTQEFAHVGDRARRLARDLLGYGTVTGLEVEEEDRSEAGVDVREKPD